MKKIFFLVLGLVLFSGSVAFAQNTFEARSTISVSGEAQVRVTPDQVFISMGVGSRGEDLIQTQKENDAAVKGIIEYATKDLGIERKDVQTDYISIEPVHRECGYRDSLTGKCSPLDIIYYKAQKNIQIRLKDLDKYEGLMTKSLQLGATNIDNVQFITTELRKHRDKAREMAAKAAKEKADAIAKTLGVEVGKPTAINVQNFRSSYWSGYNNRNGRGMPMQNVQIQADMSGPSGAGDSVLALGQINITATVNVTFETK